MYSNSWLVSLLLYWFRDSWYHHLWMVWSTGICRRPSPITSRTHSSPMPQPWQHSFWQPPSGSACLLQSAGFCRYLRALWDPRSLFQSPNGESLPQWGMHGMGVVPADDKHWPTITRIQQTAIEILPTKIDQLLFGCLRQTTTNCNQPMMVLHHSSSGTKSRWFLV